VRRGVWVTSSLLFMCVPAIVLLIRGTAPRLALTFGLLTGYWIFTVVFASVAIMIPAWFLRWRRWMSEGSPSTMRNVGAAFDRFLGTGNPSDARAQRNVRLFGVVLVAMFTWFAGLAWLLLRLFGLSWP
jgi:hypothetical protein